MPYDSVMTRSSANPPVQVPDDVSALIREDTGKKAGPRKPSTKQAGKGGKRR